MGKDDQLIEEIRTRIDQLCKNGVDKSIINDLLKPTKTLSRLVITSDFHILLPDYNNLEIKLAPLPKAVFLLFLRHEDGILFKHMSDHKEELTKIYERIANRSSKILINESIKAVCTPTNNSINEKCARIRKAFVEAIDEQLAIHYYITGKRGEVRRIKLTREMVQWGETI